MSTFDWAKAPKPRRSTPSREPFVELSRCCTCTPTSRDRMSGKFCAGERAISSAVIMLFDVPTMPLLRRVQLTSICGSKTCARTGATDVISASATPINLTISPFPMTPRSFVCVRANCEHIGEDQTRCKGSQARSRRRGSHLRNVVGEAAHTAFAPALPSPLRKTAPYGRPVHRLGDCAGRSPGSRVVALVVRPSQFPSGQFGPKARRLQLRGQPRIASHSKATHAFEREEPVFPL